MINKKKFSFPGGESQDQLENRVKKFFSKIVKLNKKEIVVCSHNNFIRIILGKILKINKKNYYKIQVPYAKKNKICYKK